MPLNDGLNIFLLSTHTVALVRLLDQIIQFREQFSDYPIKTIHFDNATDQSRTFDEYYMSIGIDVEYVECKYMLQKNIF